MKLMEDLCGSTVLITGATGLIGKSIIYKLLAYNRQANIPVRIIAVARNLAKARRIFKKDVNLDFWVTDICDLKAENRNVDYIIHAASQTSSKAFIENPVETSMTALVGTINVLEFARQNPVKGFVYLSSMEVYGTPTSDEKISEISASNLNTAAVRSCYPESKRMCESLCVSYLSEYCVPAKIVRLTQTFGPGVEYHDGRVFAEFARCAIEGNDIVLHTKGDTKRNYLYTDDAVNAVLTVLLRGQPGEAYNAANESTYCSIYEMACLVAEKCAKKKIKVIVKAEDNAEKMGYAPTLHMNLNAAKLQELGWQAYVDLEEMYQNMILDMIKKM
ncbi:MAG: NAD(P)-dependent oxidoreductase [Clostridiales bacterium]|nr:NAD(P)-dependent oxidoreductase [Clostridiales bacterium]